MPTQVAQALHNAGAWCKREAKILARKLKSQATQGPKFCAKMSGRRLAHWQYPKIRVVV